MSQEKSEYDIQAENFLNKYGLAVTFELIDQNPNKLWEDDLIRNHYKVTITRNGNPNGLTIEYWDSAVNTEADKVPTAYDVLAVIGSQSTVYDTFEDFCSEFGYDEDSRTAERIYKAYNEEAKSIVNFFTEIELEDLREIR